MKKIKFLAILTVLCSLIPVEAQAKRQVTVNDVENHIIHAVTGRTFSDKVSYTRPYRLRGVELGKTGAEYILSDARISVINVDVQPLSKDILNPDYVVKIRAYVDAEYLENYFNGFSHKPAKKKEQEFFSEVEFSFRVDDGEVKFLDAEKIMHKGSGKSFKLVKWKGAHEIKKYLETVVKDPKGIFSS